MSCHATSYQVLSYQAMSCPAMSRHVMLGLVWLHSHVAPCSLDRIFVARRFLLPRFSRKMFKVEPLEVRSCVEDFLKDLPVFLLLRWVLHLPPLQLVLPLLLLHHKLLLLLILPWPVLKLLMLPLLPLLLQLLQLL
jgi:hypothetical protein